MMVNKRSSKRDKKRAKRAYDHQSREGLRKSLKARGVAAVPTKRTARQSEYRLYLKSDHWILFRLAIIAQRGAYCERCRSPKRIQVHHLTYERLGKELLSDVEILCKGCHERAHGIDPYGALAASTRKPDLSTQAIQSRRKQRIGTSLSHGTYAAPGRDATRANRATPETGSANQ